MAGRSHCWAGASAPQIVLEGCNIRSCSTCPLAVVRLMVYVMQHRTSAALAAVSWHVKASVLASQLHGAWDPALIGQP